MTGEAEENTRQLVRVEGENRKKMMTYGRIEADTLGKMIKNGTSKHRGGERKIWSPEGRTSMANEQWETIREGRGREN